MKNTLRLGEAIYKILYDYNNVYPLIAPEDAEFPFIVYRRSSGYSQSAKDGIYSVVSNMEILVASDVYAKGIEMAEEILRKMEATRGKVGDFEIIRILMTNCDEVCIDEVYIQQMTFTIEFAY